MSQTTTDRTRVETRDERIRRLVAEAPPLTPAQAARIATLLGPIQSAPATHPDSPGVPDTGGSGGGTGPGRHDLT
jgi:hypothetical protein